MELRPIAEQPHGLQRRPIYGRGDSLAEGGQKNRPYFRVVVTDKLSPRDGRFLELVGTYDPMGKNEGMKLKLDRIDHWIGRGAKASETVASFIRKARRAAKA